MHRELSAQNTGQRTDAAISPGSSGGALIGINVAHLPQTSAPVEGIGFAIPSYTATSVADQIVETGEASHSYFGISLADLSPQAAEQGSPASDAGLSQGDVITAVDSTNVEDSGDLIIALRGYAVGDTVTLTYASGGSQRETDVTLGSLD